MENIAFYLSGITFYRSGLFIALGVVAAVVCAFILWNSIDDRGYIMAVTVALGVVLGILCSRLVYWYCCYEQYSSIFSALIDFKSGGFSLLGAMAGVLLAVIIVRACGLVRHAFKLLDCIAPAAALGIAVGRLAGFFTADDKAKSFSNALVIKQGFPFTVAVTDSVTGNVEWRFPTFFYESVAAAAIFVFSLMIFSQIYFKRSHTRGTAFWMFLSLFGATQAMLESTRYEALFLHLNGFLSLMQIAAAVMLVVPVVVFGIKGITDGNHITPVFLWLFSLMLVGAAGYLEYYVQRHGSSGVLIYPVMLICLMAVSVITFLHASHVAAAYYNEYEE